MIHSGAALAALLLAALPQTPAPASSGTGWTWTLYADEGPVVLAHEIPDTSRLREILECEAGRGVVEVTLYGADGVTGMARVSAGEATAVAQAQPSRGGGMKLALLADHPAFAAFNADGRLAVAFGEDRRMLEVPPGDLVKLRRFTELCSA